MIGNDVTLADRERFAAQANLDAGTFAFINGAAGNNAARDRNYQAWRNAAFAHAHPKPVGKVDIRGSMFGKVTTMPTAIAPVGIANALTPDEFTINPETQKPVSTTDSADFRIARAAAKAGVPMCVSTFSSTDIGRLKDTGVQLVFQLYWRPSTTEQTEILNKAVEAGATAVIVTVDTPKRAGSDAEAVTGFKPPFDPAMTTDTEIHPDVSVSDVRELAKSLTVPVYVKGVLSAKPVIDLTAAATTTEAPVKGVIVSNHSGRQLDSAQATVDAFRSVKAGWTDTSGTHHPIPEGTEVLIDSGIRTGWDIARAKFLGAHGTLIGRQALYAVAAGGEKGLVAMLERCKQELTTAYRSAGVGTSSEAATFGLAG